MSTTALIIEFLITGLQAAVWLILMIFTFFGFDWLVFEKIKGWEAIAAAILIPILYPLGVFIDNLADSILKKRNKDIRTKYIKAESQTAMKLLATLGNEWLSNYFDYNRAKIRIARSSALNLSMITFWLPIFTFFRIRTVAGTFTLGIIIFELIIGGCLAYLAFWSWRHVTHTFYRRLEEGYEMLPHLSKTAKPQSG